MNIACCAKVCDHPQGDVSIAMAEPRVIKNEALGRIVNQRGPFMLLALAAALFAIAQVDLWGLNGVWADEYFSIYASDPAQPFSSLFAQRIITDSNPPLYYSLLYLYRLLIGDARVAFLALNITALALAAIVIVKAGARAGLLRAGLACAGLFLVSGPALAYAPEGRSYFMALCVTLTIAWLTAQTIETGGSKGGDRAFAVLGGLAALIHPFAALAAGALGAGTLAEGLLRRRADLIRAGLFLGVATTLVFGVWLAIALSHIGNISFLEFTPDAVKDAVWYVRQLAVGPNLAALAVAAFLAVSALRREIWPLFRVLAIAAALFIALPILVSFKTPLISGRYWLIGAPLLIVAMVFAMRAQILAASAEGRARWIALFGGLCLVAMTAFGFFNARDFTETKPIWRGVTIVRGLIGDCPPRSVRIPRWRPLYAIASGAPEGVFLDLTREDAPPLAARAAQCPVIGWAEHVRRGDRFMTEASDAQLLAILHITGAPGADVKIVRHNSGFVILRADAPR
jgi:hypothetical protein